MNTPPDSTPPPALLEEERERPNKRSSSFKAKILGGKEKKDKKGKSSTVGPASGHALSRSLSPRTSESDIVIGARPSITPLEGSETELPASPSGSRKKDPQMRGANRGIFGLKSRKSVTMSPEATSPAGVRKSNKREKFAAMRRSDRNSQESIDLDDTMFYIGGGATANGSTEGSPSVSIAGGANLGTSANPSPKVTTKAKKSQKAFLPHLLIKRKQSSIIDTNPFSKQRDGRFLLATTNFEGTPLVSGVFQDETSATNGVVQSVASIATPDSPRGSKSDASFMVKLEGIPGGIVKRVYSSANMIGVVSQTGDFYVAAAPVLHHSASGQPPPEPGQEVEVHSGKEFRLIRVKGMESLKRAALSDYHSCALTEDGKIYTWGMNVTDPIYLTQDPSNGKGINSVLAGQLGHGGKARYRFAAPLEVKDIPGNAIDVAVGSSHTVVLTDEGVFTCGNPMAVGRPETFIFDRLMVVPGLQDIKIAAIACGDDHTLAVEAGSGSVYSWGLNDHGQVGQPRQCKYAAEPALVSHSKNVSSVVCGPVHSVCVGMTGFVIVWGSNLCGELGIGSEEGRIFEPTLVPGALAEEHTVISASCSKDCTFVVTDTGEVFQAGLFNASGLSGFSRTFRRVPIEAKYVGGAAVGRSHVVYLIDQALTHLMAQLMEPRSGSAEAFVRKLLRLFQVAVDNDSAALINGIQSRVNRLAAEQDEQIPRIRLDQAVLSTVLQPGVKRTATHIIRVSNINSFRIECDAWWSLTDTSGGVEVTFSPTTFVIEEGESVFMRVEVNLLDETRTSGSFQTLCQMSARRLRKKSSGSSGGFASHFFLVDVKFAEKDQERDPELVQHLVDTMSTYVPRSILYELQEDPAPPNGPRQVSFPGAILFIDVSGFTALNARLSALGPAGPEQVSMHLNRYFGQLIDAVHKHGGDVLKFAGDALICLFGAPNCGEELSVLIQRAVQCGMEMQQGDLREYDSQQGFALTIHIGVGGGDIHWIYLGGVDAHYEHIIMGDPMLQLATAVDLSKTGEVVVSAEAFALIKDRVKGEERGENNFLVCGIEEEIPVAEAVATAATAEMEAGLRCFLPTSVLARIDALHMSWLAELRRVTVMFVNLTSLTYERGQQVQLDAINEVLCSMQRIVFRYEGMVRQFIVDDKGTVLIAVFGVPPFGHEDDADRGMKTAWEIHHKLLESNVSNSIGVTTGKVFCGSVGSSKRQEYAMVGDIVNLSARLMGVAKNLGVGIIVDESTRDYTGDLVQYEVLEPVMVKGKEEPIPIAKPVGLKESATEHHSHQNLPNIDEESRRASALPEIPMVARKAEMGLLQLQVAKLQARKQNAMDSRGSTKTFLLSGNAGMGKTRIINELARLCRKQKVEYYIGQCNALEKTKPFFVFQTILEQLINLELWKQRSNETNSEDFSLNSRLSHWQGDSSTVAAAFGISKDSNWAEYLPLLNSVLPLGLPENDMCAKLDFDKKHMLTISFMAYLIQARATEKPVVLMVEDLQWIDASSMELLAAVAAETSANTKGVLIVLSQRSRPQHPHYKQLLQLTGVEELKLMPLSERDCRQIACSTLGVPLSAWLPELDKSTVKAHGNPLFAMEIAYSLRESGAIEVVGEKLVFNAEVEKGMEIPETIEGMIGSRIDQLPSGPQLLLKVASVVGMEFSESMLAAIYPIPSQTNTIPTSLKELTEVGLLERLKDSPAYKFKNDTVRDVTYMRMLFTQRQQLHEKIALYYEEQKNAAEADPRLVLALAKHWRDALISKSDFDSDRVCRAAAYLISASGFMANEDNMEESSNYLQDAEKLIQMLPESEEDQKNMIQRSVDMKRKTLAKKEAIQRSTKMWLGEGGDDEEESEEVIVFDEA